ncbi:MAG: hypothetical protein B6A08_14270 [Sorangiineae bacterium NIC37A_2]|nr:MAG: hypothetical protein B6A08_14270 [Sorangiineae bacterium NIC37A_2]
MNQSGRVVAITGAASGIGRALAFSYAARGARLALADWNEEGLEAARAELARRGASPLEVSVTRLDVSRRDEVFAWARATRERFGVVHVLINNAGVSLHVPVTEMDPEDLKWLLSINFWGVVHGTQAFLPYLIESGSGQIANLSSIFGIIAAPGSSSYVASKFAVRGFTEALEIELRQAGHPVSVTCVHPGGIRTGIVRNGRVRGAGPGSSTLEEAARAFDERLARTSPQECAEKIVRALEKKRPRALIGPDAHLLDLFARIFPSSYRALLARLLQRSE